MAILKAIRFSNDCGLFPCVLASDAEVVVNWIKKGSHRDSASGVILADIFSLSAERIDLDINFEPRQTNMVAHSIARNALRSFMELFWMEEVPLFAVSLVRADMPNPFSGVSLVQAGLPV
ncbi:hypothetical protein Q3G72_033412 [Acer saccharum]|nr:hypothetical protein Q3G72_033412 [Acer saccharum]